MTLRTTSARLRINEFLALAGLSMWSAIAAADPVNADDVGQPIQVVVDRLRAGGEPFAYSTSVLTDDMTVSHVPSATEPAAVVAELVAAYSLQVVEVNGTYVIGRKPAEPGREEKPPARNGSVVPPSIDEMIVSASHYELVRNALDAGVFVAQNEIQRLPVIADDPVRAVQRIPGTASGGVSARPYVRGGEPRDTGIVLNGNRLLEPFHVRNFQNLFSTIDSRAIDGIQVYTGNFPVRYGQQSGGLIIIDSLTPQDELHTELGLSVFNTSVLSTGRVADGRLGWVASARRGNLDQIIDDEFGEPAYNDFFGHIETRLSDATSVSVNALLATNDIRIITESDPLEPEQSDSDSRSAQFWVNWEQRWSDNVDSTTTVSVNSFNNRRIEFVDDPQEIVASVDDFRDVRVARIEQHWSIRLPENHELLFGAEFEDIDSTFNYAGSAEYFGVYRFFDGDAETITRDIDADVSGNASSLYLSDQWKLSDRSVLRLGLRWDHQGYTRVGDRGQLSPRLSLAHALGPRTEIRLNAGRYYQAQGVQELQVEDGIDTYFPAQKIDSGVLGIQHRLNNGLSLRGEVYLKRSDRLRPRFENVLNPIELLAEYKPDRARISPSALAARGLELSFEHKVTDNFVWWGSYVLSTVEDRVDGGDVPRSWDQRHAAQLGLSWESGRWQYSAVATGHSGWPKTTLTLQQEGQAAPVLSFSPRASERYGDFGSLDFRIRYRRPVRIGELSFFLEVSNATNRNNQCCLDFDVELDDDGTASLELEEEYWLPLLPAMGVLWQF